MVFYLGSLLIFGIGSWDLVLLNGGRWIWGCWYMCLWWLFYYSVRECKSLVKFVGINNWWYIVYMV